MGSQKERVEKGKNNKLPSLLELDYVEEAERVIQKIKKNAEKLTITKLRSIYSLITEIYNVEIIRNEETLTENSKNKIKMLRVRIIYEAGRDEKGDSMKPFIEEANLINYIKEIDKNRNKFIIFARYMEALVAYHKFYGGKDN